MSERYGIEVSVKPLSELPDKPTRRDFDGEARRLYATTDDDEAVTGRTLQCLFGSIREAVGGPSVVEGDCREHLQPSWDSRWGFVPPDAPPRPQATTADRVERLERIIVQGTEALRLSTKRVLKADARLDALAARHAEDMERMSEAVARACRGRGDPLPPRSCASEAAEGPPPRSSAVEQAPGWMGLSRDKDQIQTTITEYLCPECGEKAAIVQQDAAEYGYGMRRWIRIRAVVKCSSPSCLATHTRRVAYEVNQPTSILNRA